MSRSDRSTDSSTNASPDMFGTLISVVSWEDRFALGLERLLADFQFESVLLLRFEEWAEWTYDASQVAQALCETRSTTLEELVVPFNAQQAAWSLIREKIARLPRSERLPLVDISTMPRETIWTLFFFLQNFRGDGVAYAYHKPQYYPDTWLSRDSSRPRSVLQMSGVSRFGRPTVLLVSTGFDPSRTEQLMRAFEPTVTLMGIQEGTQFQNPQLNLAPHQQLEEQIGSRLSDRNLVQSFAIDAYANDHGKEIIERQLRPYLDNANIVMSSLGPKLSAVALYEIHRAFPETGLVYAPSKEYNRRYSAGIGDTTVGFLDDQLTLSFK